MRSDEIFRINQFNGLNTSQSPQQLNDFELSESVDVYQNNSTHELIKREPFVATSLVSPWPLSTNIRFFGVFVVQASSQFYYLAVDSSTGKIVVYKTVAGTYVNSTGTGYTNILNGLQYNDRYYFLSAAGIFEATVAELDAGYNDVVTAGTPGCEIGCMFKDRLFVVDYTATDTVKYSNIGDPVTFPGANFVRPNPGDGQKITGLFPLNNDKLLIFKGQSIYVLYVQGTDTTSWQLKLLHQSYGCSSWKSLKFFEGLLYFISTVEVCVTDGIDVRSISTQLDFALPAATTAQQLINAEAAIINRHYTFVSPLDTYGQWYAYNVDLNVWTKWTRPSSAATDRFFGFFDQKGYGFSSSSGIVCGFVSTTVSTRAVYTYRENLAVTAGSADVDVVSLSIQSKTYDLDEPDIYKRWKYIDVEVYGEGTILLTTTNGTGTVSSSQSLSGASGLLKVLRFKVFRYEKALKFNITSTTYRMPFKILSINVAVSRKTLTPKSSSNG